MEWSLRSHSSTPCEQLSCLQWVAFGHPRWTQVPCRHQRWTLTGLWCEQDHCIAMVFLLYLFFCYRKKNMFRQYDQQLHLERWYRVSMPAVYLLRWISYITCSWQFSQKNFEISAMVYSCQLCFYLRPALLLQHGVQHLNTVKLSPCRTVLVSYSRCHLRWCSSLCRHLRDCIYVLFIFRVGSSACLSCVLSSPLPVS